MTTQNEQPNSSTIDVESFLEYDHEQHAKLDDTIEFSGDIQCVEPTPEEPAESDPVQDDSNYVVTASEERKRQATGEHDVYCSRNNKRIAVIIVVILIIAFTIVAYLLTSAKPEPVSQPTQTIQAPIVKHKTYLVQAEVYPSDAFVLINAMATSAFPTEGHRPYELPLLTNGDNQLYFYADKHIPQLITLPENEDKPLDVKLTSEDTYQHTRLRIKRPSNSDIKSALYFINGKPFPVQDEQVIDCISGFPYFIHVRQDGFGDHLQVLWPIRNDETIELPDLIQLTENNIENTELTIDVPNDFSADKSSSLHIFSGTTEVKSHEYAKVNRSKLLHFNMSRNGKSPLDMIINPAGYGSISIKPYLNSIQDESANIELTTSTPEITVCLRRPAEVHCLNSGEKLSLNEGKWEIAVYRQTGDNKQWLDSFPYVTLNKDGSFVLSVTASSSDFTFQLSEPNKANRHRHGLNKKH